MGVFAPTALWRPLAPWHNARHGVVVLAFFCVLIAAGTNHKGPGVRTEPASLCVASRAPLGSTYRTGGLLLTLRLSGGSDDDRDVKQLRSVLEELKRRKQRSTSPGQSARGKPAFNQTADREMRGRRLVEEMRKQRIERFDNAREDVIQARSKSAPSAARSARSQGANGISQFTGSGGWNLNSSVSFRIWGSEPQTRAAGNGTIGNSTALFLNWTNLVSTAAIKTSASADVLSHLRGGSDTESDSDGDDAPSVHASTSSSLDTLMGTDSPIGGKKAAIKGAGKVALHGEEDVLSDEDETDADDEQEGDSEDDEEDEKGEHADEEEAEGFELEPLSDDALVDTVQTHGGGGGGKEEIRGKSGTRDEEMLDAVDSDMSAVASQSDDDSNSNSNRHANGKIDRKGPHLRKGDTADPTVKGKGATPKVSLLKTAMAGDIEAQVKVGLRFISGPAAKRNPARGLMWLKKAARAGSARAAYNVASVCTSRTIAGRDNMLLYNDTVAVRYLRTAAKLDYPPALYQLGSRHLKGEGVEKSEDRALVLWRRAGKLDHEDARYRLGLLLVARAQVQRDRLKSGGGEVAREEGGDVQMEGQGGGAEVAAADAEWKEGEKALRKAARGGHMQSKFVLGALLLGKLVEAGKGVAGSAKEPKDELVARQKEGVKFLRQAATGGVVEAQTAMGRLLLQGLHGVDRNVVDAATWIGLAAEGGDAQSQLLYGCMYLDGFLRKLTRPLKENGVVKAHAGAVLQERDPELGMQWVKKAAERGVSDAQFKLGNYLHELSIAGGSGVAENGGGGGPPAGV